MESMEEDNAKMNGFKGREKSIFDRLTVDSQSAAEMNPNELVGFYSEQLDDDPNQSLYNSHKG